MKITINFRNISHECDVDATVVGLYKSSQLLSTLGGKHQLTVGFKQNSYFCVPVAHDLTMGFLVDFFQNVKE